tara:strand:- start:492 stop:905 length:414 start_codon:yes stop_codon:yes gene_type:complete
MKNTLKLSLTFAITLMASSAFAEGAHHGKMEGGMDAQEGNMDMMDGGMKMGEGMMKDGMKMDKDKMTMMKERAAMMSKCADELEKESPNPAELKLCAKMMRKQADMMGSCMEKGCDMMKKGKTSHHGEKKTADEKEE